MCILILEIFGIELFIILSMVIFVSNEVMFSVIWVVVCFKGIMKFIYDKIMIMEFVLYM